MLHSEGKIASLFIQVSYVKQYETQFPYGDLRGWVVESYGGALNQGPSSSIDVYVFLSSPVGRVLLIKVFMTFKNDSTYMRLSVYCMRLESLLLVTVDSGL